LPFSVNDFFAVIREFYNKRAQQEKYERITFVILGVATPSDLIRDKRRTPFNISKAIELTGLKAVLDWSGGKPFLTQKALSVNYGIISSLINIAIINQLFLVI